MKPRITSLGLAALLAATIALPAVASEQRPFSGRFIAQAGPAAPRCGDDLTLGFEIGGTASHLGSFTATGSNCTEVTFAFEAVDIWDGLGTFGAADGSTITTVSEGSQDAPVAGRADFLIEHTVTGGSGRFAGASGVWEVSGVIDFTTGQVSGTVSGWISY